MFHYFVLQELQSILVQVIPNFREQHILINIFLHVVSLIPRTEIVEIPHHQRHGLRVNDPLTLLCWRKLFLVVRIIVYVIVNW